VLQQTVLVEMQRPISVHFLSARSGLDNEVDIMDPKKVAAHFVAFVYYLNHDRRRPTNPADAGQFARQNWPAFLHYADDGLGRLLTRITPRHGAKVSQTLKTRPTARKLESRPRQLAI
jgi:hypothetical protein